MKVNYANPAGDAFYAAALADPGQIPFTFTYGEKTYTGFSDPDLVLTDRRTVEKDGKETLDLTYTLCHALTVRVKLTHYFTHGVTEWTVWFANETEAVSLAISRVGSVMTFEGEAPVLKGILGDHRNSYRPYTTDLRAKRVEFVSPWGRPTHVWFPYYNLEFGTGGAMLALGWAGTYTTRFYCEEGVTTFETWCVNGLNTVLRPGEQIRTALFVYAPYTERNEAKATNFWRDWFVKWNLPKENAAGDPLKPFSTCCISNDTGLPNSDGSISERHFTWKRSLDKMIAEDCKVDFRWFDAGWYVAPNLSSPESDWWGTVGTWTLDPAKWPGQTFLESTDYARAHGMRTLMWFEPERITDPDSMVKNWGYDRSWAIEREGTPVISNNIGIPACFDWTMEKITTTLRENKVEMYREDNNSNPGELWPFLDAKEDTTQGPRSGITECKFVDGHYRMWDGLIACTLSYGGCGFVDSCASGGGRNDLESLRRGLPLLRSDADRTSTALRLSMTSSFNRWIPFCGANTKEKVGQLDPTGISDPYVWRASYLPALNVDSQFAMDPDQDFDILRFGLREWKEISPYLLKDFYPLTPWHAGDDSTGFTAYSYFDPETEEGVLFAFRQENCAEQTLLLTLSFLSGGDYTLTDKDSGETLAVNEMQITVTFAQPRTAKLYLIRKK